MIGSADLTCLPLNFSIFPRFHDRDRSCRRLFVTAEPSAVNPILPLTAGTRLSGGGKGVRTTGPLSRNESVSPAEREVAQRRKGQSRKRRISCGGPRVRISLPPAASLLRTRFSRRQARAKGRLRRCRSPGIASQGALFKLLRGRDRSSPLSAVTAIAVGMPITGHPAILPAAAAIAARTNQIRVASGVLLMPFHTPRRL